MSRYGTAPLSRHHRVEMTLLALRTAINIGGQVARLAARRWGLSEIQGTAEQMAAHLIARAVETTGNPDPDFRYIDLDAVALALVGIRVHRRAAALIIDVWDADPTPPGAGSQLDPHMAVVHTMARRWNCYPAPCGGKVIWAELAPPDH